MTSLSASGAGASGDGPTPERVVRAFLAELAEHDADGAMELLDEEFVFRDARGTFEAGREAMPAMLAWDLAAAGEIEIEELRVLEEDRSPPHRDPPDRVVVRMRERNRFTELLGLEPWRVEATFTVHNGRIREEVARELVPPGSPSFTERFLEALEPIVAWAAEAHPEEVEAIFEDGTVRRYDGESARRLLRLVNRYRRARDGAGRRR